MMIRTFLSLCMALYSIATIAQTTLPTSWDFATTPASLPTGWSTNTTNSYSSGLQDLSGGTSRAGKLESTNHRFTIEFYDEPGNVSFHLRAYSGSGGNFQGTFEVLESTDGNNWNTLQTYSNNAFGDSWTNFNLTPDPDSRFIRFNFSNKVSGYNVGLDDVSITELVPLSQEINVVYNGNDLPSGSAIQFASAVNSPLTLKFGIENLGTQQTLSLPSYNLAGSAFMDYTVWSAPTNVSPQSSDTLELIFEPSATGSRSAVLSINNNDSNETPYIILLEGVGGTGASEPSANPADLTVQVNKTYRIKADISNVTCDGYLVLFKRNASVNATITDGQSYERGQGVGNAKVAAVGPSTTFWLKEATADDTFHLAIYAYNGNGSFTNYRTQDPLIETIITPKANFRETNYYSTIDVASSSFVTDLHDVINPHTIRFYSNYGPLMVPPFVARDTTANREVLTCVYSSDEVIYNPPFGWPETGMNREHTLPSSWMPSSGSQSTPEYQDYHHLFPTVATPNSQRSNHPLGDVVNVSTSYGDGKRGTDVHGNTVYEPRDAQKGDAARAIFYMVTAYHNPSSGDSWAFQDLLSNGPAQRTDVLLEWHLSDPPSGFEHARNDYLDSLQRNRNPFVDSAHYACYIDFRTMSYIDEPDSACLARAKAIEDTNPIDTTDSSTAISKINHENVWVLYPNPANQSVYVGSYQIPKTEATLFNQQGQAIKTERITGVERVNLKGIPFGTYFLQIKNSENGDQHVFPLIIE